MVVGKAVYYDRSVGMRTTDYRVALSAILLAVCEGATGVSPQRQLPEDLGGEMEKRVGWAGVNVTASRPTAI